ncbi:hypothetical protein LCGC14_1899080 [marine sediment metagenome]|uniref:Uncharacterized protein n=1 Tax=marine sediment metagenome TaxID=412755 RepID=A0A0F9GKI6_9ZZZZ
MDIQLIPGRKTEKHPDDRIVMVRSVGKDGWEAINMEDWAQIGKFFAENEELLYPQANGNRGKWKIVDFFRDAVKHGVASAMVRHQLRPAPMDYALRRGAQGELWQQQ